MSKRVTCLLIIVAALCPALLLAGNCGLNSPATPVPECRSALDGTEVACSDPNAVRLWPEDFRPGMPGQTLPLERDSTQWISVVIPGAQTGMELFQSLDPLGDHLYVAYNAGVQVWSIAGANAEDPQRQFFRDGWLGDFLDFPPEGENDFFVTDVSAIASGDDTLVAVSGRSPVGFSIWRHGTDPATFEQLYQDVGDNSSQVRTIEFDGTLYAFTAGIDGIAVYDLTAAAGLATPCLDDNGTVCPGIFRGRVGTSGLALFLDLLERDDKIYVVQGSNTAGPVEIWEVDDPATPATAVARFAGTAAQGVAFFELDGVAYLGLVERQGSGWALRIQDVDSCLDADGCGPFGAPIYDRALDAAISSPQFLTFSRSAGTPFLYYGINDFDLDGAGVELLLDLSGLTGSTVTEITEGGGTYTDPCNGLTVDYWGDYYPGNEFGLRVVRPLVGKFHGTYFYRAAFSLLDVHVRDIGQLFADGFESGDTSAW